MLNDVVAALKGSAARSNRILQGVKGAVSSPGHVRSVHCSHYIAFLFSNSVCEIAALCASIALPCALYSPIVTLRML
jgi:hypothetical protein